ncbi:hypothetical protein AX17_002129 [Amanita inopinata Kibby_2008]|nr:hypothetical protein AX17_002129 [Amanita inopinata Kibby_2008]
MSSLLLSSTTNGGHCIPDPDPDYEHNYDFTLPREDADLILLSCEETESEVRRFYVHKNIMALASPFFRDMLRLPQPAPTSTDDDSPEEPRLPSVSLTESHTTIDLLLHLIYPIPNPPLHTLPLPTLVSLLAASTKYDIPLAVSILRSYLVSPSSPYLRDDPTRVYAVACRFGLEGEMREAMRCAMGVDVLGMRLEEEWRWVSAWEFRRLVWEKMGRGMEAGRVLEGWYGRRVREYEEAGGVGVDGSGSGVPKCVQCNGSPFTSKDEPKWWIEFVKRGKSELERNPSEECRVFSMAFLEECVKVCGCVRCAGSAVSSWRFLEGLKREVGRLSVGVEEEARAGGGQGVRHGM